MMRLPGWNTLMGLSFGAVVVSALIISWMLQKESDAEDARTAEYNLSSVVQIAENTILQRIEGWVTELETSQNTQASASQIGRSTPWLDGIYIWTNDAGKRIIYPTQPPLHTIESYPHISCLDEPFTTELPCLNESLPYAIYQSLLIAKSIGEDDPSLAAEILASPKLKIHSSIAEGIKQGVSPRWVLERQLMMLKLEEQGAPQRNMLSILRGNILDISSFNGLEIEQLMPILVDLPDVILEDDEYQEALLSALRSIATLNEVYDIIQGGSAKKNKLKIRGTTYGARPYLLLYQQMASRQDSIGVQLNPRRILDELYETIKASSTLGHIVLLDAESQLLPVQSQPIGEDEELWVQVPFGKLFPHLRVGFVRKISDQPLLSSDILAPLAPIFFGVLLGIFAIRGRILADRHQEELLERQQAFIARVTHELKTPLAGIRLMAESLKLGVVQSQEQSMQFTERILIESDRLESRINEVLQVAKRPELRIRVLIDIGIMCRDLLTEWQPRFAEVDGIFRLRVDEDHTLFGDENLLKDAIRNLLSNSIKYRNPNHQLRCELAVIDMGNFSEFSVTDNGIGVPNAFRRKIFERFVRVEGSNRGLSGGHGLGLSFVSEAAEAHGGSVRCTDGFQNGVKFILRLPIGKD